MPDYVGGQKIEEDDVRILYNHVIKNNQPAVTNPGKGRLRDLNVSRDAKKEAQRRAGSAVQRLDVKKKSVGLGFGSSNVRESNNQGVASKGPASATDSILGPSVTTTSVVGRSRLNTKQPAIGPFVKQLQVAFDKGKFADVKKKAEKAMQDQAYGEHIPVPSLHLIAAKANYELGYFPFAENLAMRVLTYEDPVSTVEASWLLAMSHRAQGDMDKAIAQLQSLLRSEYTPKTLIHKVAFELGQIFGH